MKTIIFILFLGLLPCLQGYAQEGSTTTEEPSTTEESTADTTKVHVSIPKISLEELKSQATALNFSSGMEMSVEELKKRIKDLQELLANGQHIYRYSEAYGAGKEKLTDIRKINYSIITSISFATTKIDDMRRSQAQEAENRLQRLVLIELYDTSAYTFINTHILDMLKENIFYTNRKPNFSSHAIGMVIPNCKKYGINPKHSADGYRMALFDTNRFFLMLIKVRETEKTYAILWKNSFRAHTESAVWAVYGGS